MKLSVARLGLEFGHLAKKRGIVYFQLSPFEQRAFAGTIVRGLPNTIRRFSENFWRVVPSFVMTYYIFTTVEKEAERMKRKNPADYECDE